MKTRFNKLITGAITTIAGLGVVGSIGGTYAWYTYNTKTTASIYGTTVSCTNNLQVKLNGEDAKWRSDITSSEVNTASGTDGTLKPVSSFDGGLSFRGMPISHSTALTKVGNHDYYEFSISFREKVTGSDPFKTVNNKVYLTDATILGNNSIAPAVRMSFTNSEDETWTFAPKNNSQYGSTKLYGYLDLDNSGCIDTQYDDKITISNSNREYEWQKGYATTDYAEHGNYAKGQYVVYSWQEEDTSVDPPVMVTKKKAYQAKENVSDAAAAPDPTLWKEVADTWKPNNKYAKGDHVLYLGKVYIANAAVAEDEIESPIESSKWVCKTFEIMYGASKVYEATGRYDAGEYVFNATDNKVYVAIDDIVDDNTMGDDNFWAEAVAEYYGNSTTGNADEHAITELVNDDVKGGRKLANANAEGKVIAEAIEATEFDKKVSYAQGDLIYVDEVLYEAKQNIAAGNDYNAAEWKVHDLTKSKSTIKIRVWLEGWDSAISDMSIDSSFQLGLQFETLN